MKSFGSSRSGDSHRNASSPTSCNPRDLVWVLAPGRLSIRLLTAALVIASLMVAQTALASLSKAAKKGDLAKVEKLIAEGADIDASDFRGNTPIYHAASKGHAQVVEALAQAGADVDAENGFGSDSSTRRP